MKVLHIFNSINHFGAEIMYASAAKLFRGNHIDLYALSSGKEPGTYYTEFQKAGYEVFHKPLVRTKSFKYFLKIIPFFSSFYRLCKKYDFDVVHIHRRHLFWLFALIARLAGIKKTIRTVHNVFRPVWYRYPGYFLRRKFAKYLLGTKITSISNSVYENEINHFNNKTIFIPNWYNDAVFYPAKTDEKIRNREKLGFTQDDFILISAGACLQQKRHSDIIKALPALKNKIPNLKYIHLGSGPLEENEKKYSKSLEVNDIIIFAGNIYNVNDYFNVSDVFIMPSDFEGLPISAIEAMGCRLPVIFYNSPGLRDLLDSTGSRGFLIDKNPKKIVDKVLFLYNYPEKATEMGKNAASFVKQHYSMKKSVERFVRLYHS